MKEWPSRIAVQLQLHLLEVQIIMATGGVLQMTSFVEVVIVIVSHLLILIITTTTLATSTSTIVIIVRKV